MLPIRGYRPAPFRILAIGATEPAQEVNVQVWSSTRNPSQRLRIKNVGADDVKIFFDVNEAAKAAAAQTRYITLAPSEILDEPIEVLRFWVQCGAGDSTDIEVLSMSAADGQPT